MQIFCTDCLQNLTVWTGVNHQWHLSAFSYYLWHKRLCNLGVRGAAMHLSLWGRAEHWVTDQFCVISAHVPLISLIPERVLSLGCLIILQASWVLTWALDPTQSNHLFFFFWSWHWLIKKHFSLTKNYSASWVDTACFQCLGYTSSYALSWWHSWPEKTVKHNGRFRTSSHSVVVFFSLLGLLFFPWAPVWVLFLPLPTGELISAGELLDKPSAGW